MFGLFGLSLSDFSLAKVVWLDNIEDLHRTAVWLCSWRLSSRLEMQTSIVWQEFDRVYDNHTCMFFSAETKGALGAETNSALQCTTFQVPKRITGLWLRVVTKSLLQVREIIGDDLGSFVDCVSSAVSEVSEVSALSQSPTQVGGTNLYAAGNIRWILAIFLSMTRWTMMSHMMKQVTSPWNLRTR